MMGYRKRLFWTFPLLFLFIGGISLMMFGDVSSHSTPHHPASLDKDIDRRPAPPAKVKETRAGGSPSITLRPIDQLTSENLDLQDLILIGGDGSDPVALLGKEPRVLSRDLLGKGYDWEYTIGFGPEDWARRTFRIPESEASPEEDGTLRLPYSFGIRGSFSLEGTLSPIPGAYVSAWCISKERVAEVLADLERKKSFPPDIASNLFFLKRLLGDKYDEIARFDSRTDQDGLFSLFVPAVGSIKVQFWAPAFSLREAEVVPVPGQWVNIDLSTSAKPTIRGRVIDSSGNPVPDAEVRVAASFGRDARGLSPFEQEYLGFGVIYSTFGDDAACGLKALLRTDQQGRFQIQLPEAPRYAAGAFRGLEYGFTALEHPVPSMDGFIDLDVFLLPSSEEDGVSRVLIKSANGDPLPGIDVHMAIVDDYIWQRQFPTIRSDDAGRLTVPWLEPGYRYGFFLSAKDVIKPVFLNYQLGDGDIEIPEGSLLDSGEELHPVNTQPEPNGGSRDE